MSQLSYILLTRDEVHKLLIDTAAKSNSRIRKVGAVLCETFCDSFIDDTIKYRVLSTGYNHAPYHDACEYRETNDGPLITREEVVHAEVACLNNVEYTNNLDDHPFSSSKPANLILFCTYPPCDSCLVHMKSFDFKYKPKSLVFEVMGDFMKFDNHKPRMSLVPSSLNMEVAKVLTYGAKKYKVNNWRQVPSLEPYINALERHLAAYKNGEDLDQESGLMHLSHLACNVAFLIELTLTTNLEKVNKL